MPKNLRSYSGDYTKFNDGRDNLNQEEVFEDYNLPLIVRNQRIYNEPINSDLRNFNTVINELAPAFEKVLHAPLIEAKYKFFVEKHEYEKEKLIAKHELERKNLIILNQKITKKLEELGLENNNLKTRINDLIDENNQFRVENNQLKLDIKTRSWEIFWRCVLCFGIIDSILILGLYSFKSESTFFNRSITEIFAWCIILIIFKGLVFAGLNDWITGLTNLFSTKLARAKNKIIDNLDINKDLGK